MPRWRHLADTVAAQLLWQLTPDGGFIHASAEFEPTYTREESCPIHQMMPMIALLDYYEQRGVRHSAIAPLIERSTRERHVSWFTRHWWKRGNEFCPTPSRGRLVWGDQSGPGGGLRPCAVRSGVQPLGTV